MQMQAAPMCLGDWNPAFDRLDLVHLASEVATISSCQS